MEISLEPTEQFNYIIVKILHINFIGAIVKLELEHKNDIIIYDEILAEYFNRLALKKGEFIYTRPKEIISFETEALK